MGKKRKVIYKLIITANNKQIEYVGYWERLDSALNAFDKKIKESERVVFPARQVNTKEIKECRYNLVLLKKREEDEKNHLLRNAYGEYVEHKASDENWVVYNIADYNIEETFWVYGYHPKKQRKTFSFIYETFVKSGDKYDFVNITLFKNKVLFETYNSFNMVICKNRADALRMYNQLMEYAIKDKIKYYIFSGDGDRNYKKKEETLKRIQNHTHWNNKKILRASTRP